MIITRPYLFFGSKFRNYDVPEYRVGEMYCGNICNWGDSRYMQYGYMKRNSRTYHLQDGRDIAGACGTFGNCWYQGRFVNERYYGHCVDFCYQGWKKEGDSCGFYGTCQYGEGESDDGYLHCTDKCDMDLSHQSKSLVLLKCFLENSTSSDTLIPPTEYLKHEYPICRLTRNHITAYAERGVCIAGRCRDPCLSLPGFKQYDICGRFGKCFNNGCVDMCQETTPGQRIQHNQPCGLFGLCADNIHFHPSDWNYESYNHFHPVADMFCVRL